MSNKLAVLSEVLRSLGFNKSAEQIDELMIDSEPNEYEESWHEEVVKEFEEPFEENIEDLLIPPKYTGYDKSTVSLLISLLKKHNIIPHATGSHSGFLGEGVFGKVFNCIYQGKPVAAKIGLLEGDSEFINDVVVW